MRYLDAMLALGLAAEIHGTDAAVKKVAERCVKRVERRYRPVLFDIINARSPLLQVIGAIATLPEHILTMSPGYVPPPHVVYAQLREKALINP